MLLQQFVAVRQAAERKAGGSKPQQQQQPPAAAAAAGRAGLGSSTLPAETVNLLRHAFILLAGGDGRNGRGAAVVQRRQLTELVVLAGLDPAAPPVVKLQTELAAACGDGSIDGDGSLQLDEFLAIVLHFRQSAPQQQLGAVGDAVDGAVGGGERWRPAASEADAAPV